MTTMIAELYDALIAAGSPEDKARKAAEAMAGYEAYEQRLVRIEADIGELKRDVAELKLDVGELRRAVSNVEQRLPGVEQRLSGLVGDVLLLKWMLGFVLAFQVALFIKLFLH
jgi:predicted RNase H-like nuclease (RuvC/YqgF family)